MKVIIARNVHEALPSGLAYLHAFGVRRDSRNGPVLQSPFPVSTVYKRPMERVILWPERDANPFFHLYESLWMLTGRNDLAPLLRYVKTFGQFSDDGQTLHGAYGYRWRRQFSTYTRNQGAWSDQLEKIAQMLRENPEERRAVLQMWDSTTDLAATSKDIPCNDIATFQRGPEGELNLVVFCRSNDIVLGCYGANAVHFSMLLEYMALWIGCAVGTYTQVSVNWHGYLDTLKKVDEVARQYGTANPYESGRVVVTPMAGDGDHQRLDELIETIVDDADSEFSSARGVAEPEEPWANSVFYTLFSHQIYRESKSAQEALDTLSGAVVQNNDWVTAAREWYQRRLERGK